MHIKLPYSQQSGRVPSPDRLKTGELWINGADAIIGTKNNENQVLQYAQLTPEQREHVLNDFIPREGLVNHVSVAQAATSIKGGTSDVTIAINDDSNTAIEYTVDCDRLVIDISKTKGHKATKVVISKPAQKQVTIEWKGVDHWLSSIDVPTFGQSLEVQELCVAVFSSPSINCVNVIYNTEVLGSSDDEAVWGLIGGDITDQEDLQQALATKVDIVKHNSDLATKVSKSDYEADKTSLFATKSELDVLEKSVVKLSQNNTDLRSNIVNTATDKAAYISLQSEDLDRHSDLSTGTDKVSGNAWFRLNASNKIAPTSTYDQVPETKTRIEGTLNKGIVIEQSGITKPLIIRSTSGDVSLINNTGTLNVSDLQTLNTQALRKGGNVVLSGDVSGTCTLDGSETATLKTTLANTSVKAGTYGQAIPATLEYGQSFTIPHFTVDTKGRLTNAAQYTITLPNEQTTITGNAGSATKLETARTIALNGTVTGSATAFDGTTNIVIKTTVDGSKVSGTVPAATKATQDGNGKVIATTYAPLINPTFVGTVISPSFKGELSGNASTANKLAAARTITLTGDVTSSATTFDGSTNITITSSIPLMGAATTDTAGKKGLVPPPAANQQGYYLRGDGKWAVPTNNRLAQYAANDNVEYPLLAKRTTAATNTTDYSNFVGSVTLNPSLGQITATTFKGALIGNAATASKAAALANARTIAIGGAVTGAATSFNGTANITINTTAVDGSKVTGTVPAATKATQDGGGKVIASTYAPIANPTFTGTVNGTFKGNLTGNASSATKATQDGNGNTITTTYAPIASPTFTGIVTAPTFKGALTGNAATATKATQDGNGKVIASTYAPIANPTFTGTVNGTFKGNLTGNVTGNASSATKATQDGNGKVIADTYATNDSVNAVISLLRSRIEALEKIVDAGTI